MFTPAHQHLGTNQTKATVPRQNIAMAALSTFRVKGANGPWPLDNYFI